MSNKPLTIAMIVLVALVGVLVIQNSNSMPFGAITSGYNIFSAGVISTTTDISASVGTTTTNLLLARDVNRQWAMIQNNEAANQLTIQFTTVTSTLVSEVGIVLDQYDIFEIDPDNLYIGDIYSIASSSTNTASIMYK